MTSDIRDLRCRAVERFGELVHLLRPEDWIRPTPCEDWSVRDLVNHVTGENLWTGPLLSGSTIEDMGDAFDGDVLGAVPAKEWDAAAGAALAAAGEDALDRNVSVSFGEIPAHEYLAQPFTDHVIHSWDLAVAIAPAVPVQPGADPQARLLARFGRTPG